MLLSDDRSKEPGVAIPRSAAAGWRYLVLRQQISDAARAAAALGAAAAERGSSPPVGTEAIRAGRFC